MYHNGYRNNVAGSMMPTSYQILGILEKIKCLLYLLFLCYIFILHKVGHGEFQFMRISHTCALYALAHIHWNMLIILHVYPYIIKVYAVMIYRSTFVHNISDHPRKQTRSLQLYINMKWLLGYVIILVKYLFSNDFRNDYKFFEYS